MQEGNPAYMAYKGSHSIGWKYVISKQDTTRKTIHVTSHYIQKAVEKTKGFEHFGRYAKIQYLFHISESSKMNYSNRWYTAFVDNFILEA